MKGKGRALCRGAMYCVRRDGLFQPEDFIIFRVGEAFRERNDCCKDSIILTYMRVFFL